MARNFPDLMKSNKAQIKTNPMNHKSRINKNKSKHKHTKTEEHKQQIGHLKNSYKKDTGYKRTSIRMTTEFSNMIGKPGTRAMMSSRLERYLLPNLKFYT